MMIKKKQGRAGAWWPVLLIVVTLTVAALAGCGPQPEPTLAPTDTPLPTGTVRPTFTATTLAQATEEATPTQEPTQTAASPTPRPATRTPRPVATTADPTPTAAATRSSEAAPRLLGVVIYPIFEPGTDTYNIYVMDLATGRQQLLIAEGSQPAVSLVNGRIAWHSWNQEQRGLLSRPLDSTDVWQMVPYNEAARPDWDPSGEEFVFHSRQESDREARLYMFTGAGEEQFIEIQRNGSPIIGRAPVFLPDGRIVYQGCIENSCGLYVMDADGTNPQQISTHKDDTTPAVSPDGTKIAFMSQLSGSWQVNVINVDGTEQRRLTDDRFFWNGLPAWSPDGRNIVFVSTRDETWPNNFEPSENRLFRLWVMDADGENQRPLSEFSFRLDGVPAGIPESEVAGWIEERLVWLPPQLPTN